MPTPVRLAAHSRASSQTFRAERPPVFMSRWRIPSGTSATSSFCRSNSDLDQACACTRSINLEPGHADRKAESAWPGTAWIKEEDSFAAFNGRAMRMPGDDNLNVQAAAVGQFFSIVEHKDGNVFDLDCFQLRNTFGPLAGVVVPSNRNRWSNFV